MSPADGGARSMQDQEPIAIVGMAGIYPKAPDLQAYWRNIMAGVDAVDDAPEDWCGDLFLDPESSENDRIYTKRGGFLGDLAVFDPLKHGVMPSSIDGGEPDQFLALEVAARAVADAGFDQRPVPGDRVAVILGRGTYINRGFTTVVQHGIMVDRMLAILKKLHPDTSEGELAEVKATLKASLPPFNAEMSPALVPNLVTGRIANRLDFRGTNYIVDAACASSLIALERGVADLRAGRCDMAVVGGVHASTPPPIYMIFCQLEALSRKGRIRPFSAEADGTLLAEGVGLLCIKRVSDAEAAGDRIYALVKSVGVASDGRGSGILAPRLEGEMLALSRAYDEAGVDPATIGLVEAHGTATTVGDATEVEALARQFGPRKGGAPGCALGSVKSMIGHCLPASGSAGLIKTALALHHRVLPPTLVDTPNPKLGIEKTPFYLNTEARPWVHGGRTPRRAGVNAFGFGGINAHAILEEYPGPQPDAPELFRGTEAILLDADSAGDLRLRVAEVKQRLANGPFNATCAAISTELGSRTWRAAVVASDAEDASMKLDRIVAALDKGKTRLRDRRGVYLGAEPLGFEGKVAFMFPGEGSQHTGMLRDLMLHFPVMRQWFDLVDGAFADAGRDLLPSQAIFPPPGMAGGNGAGDLWRMDLGPEAIFAANQAMHALFSRLGVRADMLVGHSTGEYSALYAAGVTARDDPDDVQREMRALNDVYQRLNAEGAVTDGVLVALGAVSADALKSRLDERKDVWLAMDNCPNQLVLATTSNEGAAWAEATAAALGGVSELLPFRRAYHCPAFQGFSDGLKSFLETLPVNPPSLPTYSCLTAAPFPVDPAEIRAMTAQQWAGRVRFVETIGAMYDDGARIFVECGPRNNLVSFVDDILRKQPHASIAADTVARSGLEQLQHAMAVLAVEGVEFDVAALFGPRTTADGTARRPQVLKMGIQPMSIDAMAVPERKPQALDVPPLPESEAPSAVPSTPEAAVTKASAGTGNAMLDSYFQTLEQFLSVEQEIMGAYLGGTVASGASKMPGPAPAAAEGSDRGRFPLLDGISQQADGKLVASVTVSAENWPYLDDHSFGRGISHADPTLSGLRVVPLTFSIEVLAQAAAALHQELTVVALNEVRASRWLALEQPQRRFEVVAEPLPGATPVRVRVRLREADGPKLRPVLVEAEVELAGAAPEAPLPREMKMGAIKPAAWTNQDTYSRIMFHGPRLQAVRSVTVFGDGGAKGELVGMPADALIAGVPAPRFETDGITLDAVGQLVGVWAAEMLPERFHIFPFRAERIEIFRPPLRPGEVVTCTSEIALLPNDEMRSDIEVISPDGRLQSRVTGWWDKRFDLPDRFFRARLDPAHAMISRAFEHGVPGGVRVALADDLGDDLLGGSGGIWMGVLAGMVLGARERPVWDAVRKSAATARQMDWLRGRVAAKDAVRLLRGGSVPAADVVIEQPDPDAAPRVALVGAASSASPWLSISHAGGTGAAAAADPAQYAGVGIDIETVAPRGESFLSAAFTPDECAIIDAAGSTDRDLLVTRMWCAKEAAAKACGVGVEEMRNRFVVAPDPNEPAGLWVGDTARGAALTVWVCAELSDGFVVSLVTRGRGKSGAA